MKILTRCILLTIWGFTGSPGLAQTPDPGAHPSPWQSVEKILGWPGMEQAEMIRFDFPRSDLNVTVNGIPLEPELALTSRFSFKPFGKGTFMMGELVLLDQEVAPVTALLRKTTFQMGSPQSRLFQESPGVKTLPIKGLGSRANLARILSFILSVTGTPLYPGHGKQPSLGTLTQPTPAFTPKAVSDWNGVEAFLGPGKINGKVLQYRFSRPETILEDGVEIGSFMGMGSLINFQKAAGRVIGKRALWGLSPASKTSKDIVALSGQVLLTPEEVEPAVEILKKNRIQVVSTCPSSFPKNKSYVFLHLWFLGPPEEGASGLKELLLKIHQAETK